MEVTDISRNVRATNLPLEKLASSTQISDPDKIAEVSRQFEAVLLRQILSQAQKPLFKSSLLESDNSTNGIYQDLITNQMADRISKGGTFGFARVLNVQLSAQYLKKNAAEQRSEAQSASARMVHKSDEHGASALVHPMAKPAEEVIPARQNPVAPPVFSASRPVPPAPLKPFSLAERRPSAPGLQSRTTPALHHSPGAPLPAHAPRKSEPQPGKRI